MGQRPESEALTRSVFDSTGPTREGPPPAVPGTRLQGRFRIDSVIGEGGFGRVYKAFDERLGRDVAVKLLQRRGTREADQRFLHEARNIARLDHPHIVPVYDAGIEGEWPWLVMRLIRGASLSDQLRRSGPMAPERVRRHLLDLLDALGHAHSRGLVHRDVKPGNILVEAREDGTEHVWLADFGVAQAFTLDTPLSERTVAGTPCYMAPEQVTGRLLDPRTDLFAVGCVALELVTGGRAFEGQTATEVMYRVVHEAPRGADELAARAGPAFARSILRALAKSPEDRPRTAAELRSSLDGHSSGRAATAGRAWHRLRGLLAPRSSGSWDGVNAVEAFGVSKSYRPGTRILNELDLRVPRGSIFAILGNNGSGKTTLLRLVLGLYRCDRGRIRVFGRDPRRASTSILARVGYVPDTPAVFPALTVGETVELVRRFYPNWDNAYCYQLLGRFSLPLSERVRDLSHGLKTKVSLLLALAHRPEFLVLDDPTLGLDAVALEEFFETIREASKREGTSVLISSHNLEQLERTVSHVGFLRSGRLDHTGSVSALRQQSHRVELTFRGEPSRLLQVEGFHRLHGNGSRVTGVVVDGTPSTLERLREAGAEEVVTSAPTLRDLFIGLMGRPSPEMAAGTVPE